MVAAVSESWGVRPDGESGKVVWFTLPTPAAARPRPAAATRPPRRKVAVAETSGLRFPEAGTSAGSGTRSRPVRRCRLTGR
ncbi:non-specific serine/threonine protein kinase OS=Streptomyces violarus OX=67380 GN=FHS41_005149 PE=3 SV=1 [Streptomyces violarus]